MNIIDVIKEELQALAERQEGVYSIAELAEILNRMGYDKYGQDVMAKLLQQAYVKNGDQGVEDLYEKISGVQIEHISKGRYVFQRLIDSDKVKQAAQDARYAVRDAEYNIQSNRFKK